MKIDAFKKVFEFKGTTVYEACEIDLPLSEIFNKSCIGGAILGREHFFYQKIKNSFSDFDFGIRNRRPRYRLKGRVIEKNSIKIPLKINSKTKIINGIMTFNSEEMFAKFLAKYINLSVNCELNELLKERSRINNKPDFDFFIHKLKNDYDYPTMREIFVDLKRQDDSEVFYCFDNETDSYLIKRGDNNNLQRIFAVENKINIDGYSIPSVNFIYHGSSYSPMDIVATGDRIVAYIDNGIKIYERFYDINPAVLNKFDKFGKIYNGTCVDLLPDNSKEVFAVLRIPTKKEYKKYLEKEKTVNKDSEILNQIFFVAPSLKITNIRPDARVIDDIGIAFQIISKLSSDIYIPNNVSYELDEKLFSEKEQFLFLEKPL